MRGQSFAYWMRKRREGRKLQTVIVDTVAACPAHAVHNNLLLFKIKTMQKQKYIYKASVQIIVNVINVKMIKFLYFFLHGRSTFQMVFHPVQTSSWAKTISWLISSLSNTALTGSSCIQQLIAWVRFQVEMPNSLWLQLIKCEDLLFFPVLYHCKMYIFGQTKKAIWKHHLGFFHRLNNTNVSWLINNQNNGYSQPQLFK